MTLDKQSNKKSTSDFSAILNQMWIRFLPEIRERVATLASAAQSLGSGNLSPDQREEAHAAAHKLAGSLGTFSLSRGTELAREFELACAPGATCTSAEADRLKVIAAEILTVVDGRK